MYSFGPPCSSIIWCASQQRASRISPRLAHSLARNWRPQRFSSRPCLFYLNRRRSLSRPTQSPLLCFLRLSFLPFEVPRVEASPGRSRKAQGSSSGQRRWRRRGRRRCNAGRRGRGRGSRGTSDDRADQEALQRVQRPRAPEPAGGCATNTRGPALRRDFLLAIGRR